MGRSINIRSYRAADAGALVAAYRAAARSTAPRDYTELQVRAWAPDQINEDAFGRHCQSKSTWVAEINGKVTGFSDLEADGHVDMLYVHPEWHGIGVATALLNHIEGLAREQGLRRLYVEASITARPVFEARGFRVITEQTVSIRGAHLTNFRMEKILTAD